MFQIEWPLALLMLPLPLLAYYLLPVYAGANDAALRVPFIDDFRLSQQAAQQRIPQRWYKWLGAIAWCLLVIAASRPQWLGDPVNINIGGRDLMMAVDLSNSMATADFVLDSEAVDRLSAAKVVAGEFIDRRQGDRLGLILFGSRAYLQTPLTFDTATVRQFLWESAIGLAGERTAIGDAIGLALKRLGGSAENAQLLVLMTDGANTAGEVTPIKAAQLAAERGMKIYTIGIGADQEAQFSWFGLRQSSQASDLDEKTLTEIATVTGGRYFRARDTEELAAIYELLDKLEPIEQDEQTFRPVSALFYWPLAVALLFGGILCLRRS